MELTNDQVAAHVKNVGDTAQALEDAIVANYVALTQEWMRQGKTRAEAIELVNQNIVEFFGNMTLRVAQLVDDGVPAEG